jgi:hypothetical protein
LESCRNRGIDVVLISLILFIVFSAVFLADIYMNVQSFDWYRHFNEKWQGKTSFMGPNPPSYWNDAVMQVFST